eukprot:CAMPEP_0119321482 /NCGR_PEP_ID=MMETSP1333-20130426/55531_1 /TAXON_ID=418940 /ORGANISM="Scyphosphaera apsteinii, Strain RCC1455" /LENGTH=304 /DNA_ID=CAMNT_0007328463 /DNA_START=9 /DNA_END=923 /DNA_ORIENTATION=+
MKRTSAVSKRHHSGSIASANEMDRAEDAATANKRGRAAGIAAVRAAEQRGLNVVNHGAGTMPVDASAPYGGTRYCLLQDPPEAPGPYYVDPHHGNKDADGKLFFIDMPHFCPSLTPVECIQKGIFGGCYFNPRGGRPGIFWHAVAVDHTEFPEAWFDNLSPSLYLSRRYNIQTNAYGVKSGFGQKEWESKGWIHAQDPRGWFQWYCRFFCGRRSADDMRQVQRWCACASPNGRWRNQLCGAVLRGSGKWDDLTVSPVIRQTLLHWAYELSEADYDAWRHAKSKVASKTKVIKGNVVGGDDDRRE